MPATIQKGIFVSDIVVFASRASLGDLNSHHAQRLPLCQVGDDVADRISRARGS